MRLNFNNKQMLTSRQICKTQATSSLSQRPTLKTMLTSSCRVIWPGGRSTTANCWRTRRLHLCDLTFNSLIKTSLTQLSSLLVQSRAVKTHHPKLLSGRRYLHQWHLRCPKDLLCRIVRICYRCLTLSESAKLTCTHMQFGYRYSVRNNCLRSHPLSFPKHIHPKLRS